MTTAGGRGSPPAGPGTVSSSERSAGFSSPRISRRMPAISPVLAFGLPGTGKTHALCALGHRLVETGYSVLFTPAYRLVQELLAAQRDLQLPRALRKLDNFDFLVLDDLGYLPQGAAESEVLFTLMAERYERRAIGITSNLVRSWPCPTWSPTRTSRPSPGPGTSRCTGETLPRWSTTSSSWPSTGRSTSRPRRPASPPRCSWSSPGWCYRARLRPDWKPRRSSTSTSSTCTSTSPRACRNCRGRRTSTQQPPVDLVEDGGQEDRGRRDIQGRQVERRFIRPVRGRQNWLTQALRWAAAPSWRRRTGRFLR